MRPSLACMREAGRSASSHSRRLRGAVPEVVMDAAPLRSPREMATPISSSLLRPRIEKPVEQVRQKVDADEDGTDDDGAAEHGVHVGILQGIGDVEPDAGPGKYRLG